VLSVIRSAPAGTDKPTTVVDAVPLLPPPQPYNVIAKIETISILIFIIKHTLIK